MELHKTELAAWADSTFDKNMYTALCMTVQKKEYTKLTRGQTIAYFWSLNTRLEKLFKMSSLVKKNEIEVD
jgi:hypothetical protein